MTYKVPDPIKLTSELDLTLPHDRYLLWRHMERCHTIHSFLTTIDHFFPGSTSDFHKSQVSLKGSTPPPTNNDIPPLPHLHFFPFFSFVFFPPPLFFVVVVNQGGGKVSAFKDVNWFPFFFFYNLSPSQGSVVSRC